MLRELLGSFDEGEGGGVGGAVACMLPVTPPHRFCCISCLFAENPPWIEPPFFADYGYNIHLGKG